MPKCPSLSDRPATPAYSWNTRRRAGPCAAGGLDGLSAVRQIIRMDDRGISRIVSEFAAVAGADLPSRSRSARSADFSAGCGRLYPVSPIVRRRQLSSIPRSPSRAIRMIRLAILAPNTAKGLRWLRRYGIGSGRAGNKGTERRRGYQFYGRQDS